MTALRKYQRLECPGLWRPAPDAQRREVVVSFGDASLVVSDARSDTALSHWSLPAVDRIGTSSAPAIFTPDSEAHETLEIEDETMIEAIDTVRGVIAARRRQDGRVRRAILAAVSVAAMLAGAVWLPGALVDHTARVLPAAKRAEIGALVLEEIVGLHGQPCDDPIGRNALDRLTTRILGRSDGQVQVLRSGPSPAVHLPGGRVLLSRAVIEEADGPAVAAGHILARRVAAAAADPMIPLLRHAGTVATFRLLTSGELPAEAVAGYGAALLSREPPHADSHTLLARMAAAEVPAAPYAYALDPTGETTLALIEADPYRTAAPPPLLSDGAWVSLQGICGA